MKVMEVQHRRNHRLGGTIKDKLNVSFYTQNNVTRKIGPRFVDQEKLYGSE